MISQEDDFVFVPGFVVVELLDLIPEYVPPAVVVILVVDQTEGRGKLCEMSETFGDVMPSIKRSASYIPK